MHRDREGAETAFLRHSSSINPVPRRRDRRAERGLGTSIGAAHNGPRSHRSGDDIQAELLASPSSDGDDLEDRVKRRRKVLDVLDIARDNEVAPGDDPDGDNGIDHVCRVRSATGVSGGGPATQQHASRGSDRSDVCKLCRSTTPRLITQFAAAPNIRFTSQFWRRCTRSHRQCNRDGNAAERAVVALEPKGRATVRARLRLYRRRSPFVCPRRTAVNDHRKSERRGEQ